MTTLSLALKQLPRTSWARLVSDVFSPPVIWIALSLTVAVIHTPDGGQAIRWAAIYSLLICVAPTLFVVFMVWRGKIGDIHMKERRERIVPLLLTMGGALFAFLLLWELKAPPALPLLAFISLVQIIIMTLITLAWQISMHAMGITGAAMAIGMMFNLALALLCVPLIVLVGAARLHLQRHTPAQVLAGTLVGALVPVLVVLGLALGLKVVAL
ncbi:MAG: hypothetical protein NZ750_09350 [Anaerolineae bacterium]|nr:hypothetical protein [Anaerolineae bacterium]MDW8171825.1 hypothetical protein [Anaerolineae bacterium]